MCLMFFTLVLVRTALELMTDVEFNFIIFSISSYGAAVGNLYIAACCWVASGYLPADVNGCDR